MVKKEVLIGLGVAAAGAGALYLLTREKPPVPPPEYPVAVSRGDYSFTAHNEYEWTQLREFLGIEPVGVDLDTYLSKLGNEGLGQWIGHWVIIFDNFADRAVMMKFINDKYIEYYTEEYPKDITDDTYTFKAYNSDEEAKIKEFLGIEPAGDDIDIYLSKLDNAGLLEWKTYWDGVFLNFIEKNTLMNFVQSKYDQYYEEDHPPEYPKTITRHPYSFAANDAYEETQLKDFLGIEPVGADLDTYLSGLDNAGLLQWKNYWTGIFGNIGRTDLVTFVDQKYNEYYTEEEPVPPPPVPPPPPPPETGTLALTSDPTGAKVYLNDVYKGITPIDLTVNANQSYTVEFYKDGYVPSAVGLSVNPGETKHYHKFLTPEQPEYPKTVSRGAYSFTAHNEYEETQLKEFLGIYPPGVDLDTYLSRLDTTGLGQWIGYWVIIFDNFTDRTVMMKFINSKYSEYYE